MLDAQAESVRSALLNAAKSWNVRDLYFPYQEDEGTSFQSLNSSIQVPKDSSSIFYYICDEIEFKEILQLKLIHFRSIISVWSHMNPLQDRDTWSHKSILSGFEPNMTKG